jgi:ubiquinone/menaquinone biosynthesis C-methylase UbiE
MEEPHDVLVTRAAYDTVAVDYAELVRTALAAMPLDRAMLGVFAERVQAAGGGTVADLGCGPGRVTEYLHSRGLSTFGIDLSPGMVSVARRMYPHLRFDEGSIMALDLPERSLGGIVAWYSIIHTPPERLPLAFAEFSRVLSPGGHLLLAFQVGSNQRVRLEQAYGHQVSYDAFRLCPDHVTDLLGQAGLAVDARLLREPQPPERTQQAYLMAQKSPH